jgi:hypothetical protein
MKDKPESVRRRDLKRRYGITVEEYDAMLEQQGNRCAICRTDKPGGKGRFHVDHDHQTGEVRGLLCNNCNRALGHFKDNVLILEQAIRYLNEESN